jgi:hypothetical protein
VSEASSTVTVSPRVGALLAQVAETSDLETALWKILSEYVELKLGFLTQRVKEFEARWEMTFDEFSERCEAGTLDEDAYAYRVESDFWEWEKAVTLLQHYEALQSKWTCR